ncbi:BZ3501_MvSof-1269-A2-R1_Chr3-2g06018 [Microbotryum saponariae]|nr:BZ3501_MvSof-1269-A2-R1_Chr3-2g06018 [Microbotryum saponariae]
MAIFPPRQPPPRIKLPPGIQLGAFAFATVLGCWVVIGITFYAVLIYDFGEKEHCFMPIRRWFDAQTSGLFTLSDRERAAFDPRVRTTPLPGAVERDNMVKTDRRTPIEYFKERENER